MSSGCWPVTLLATWEGEGLNWLSEEFSLFFAIALIRKFDEQRCESEGFFFFFKLDFNLSCAIFAEISKSQLKITVQ